MKCCKLICVILLFSSLSVLFMYCNTTEPEDKLEIALEDASCTEAWINVKGETGSEIALKRDDKEVKRFILTTSPQTVYDDSLQPNKSYTYQVSSIRNPEASNKLQVITLDTTSHNYSWQIFTFGGETIRSALYDVIVINENNVWAVGEIYTKESYTFDSLGNWIDPYNAVHWDGIKWELKRIYYDYQNSKQWGPIRTIFAFDENDIWFGANLHWNGQVFEQPNNSKLIGISTINNIWGTSSNNLYGVGNNGTIIHYQNGQWSKIESGTELSFQDIWGDKDEIIAVASEKFTTGGKYLVKLEGNNAVQLNDIITTAVSLSGIWFMADRKYYLVGDGIYSKHSLDENRWQIDSIIFKIKYYPYSISGNGLNDIALCSEGSTIAHYNGWDWNLYIGENSSDRLLSIKTKGNIITAVGTRLSDGLNNKAVIYLGRR